MKTLILVDVQNDFMPDGSLPVPAGNEIVPFINRVIDGFDLVVATQDWHPPDHMSFASNNKEKKEFEKIRIKGEEQTLWPDHCIQGTEGAMFHPDLEMSRIEAIFRKGMDPETDSYSGFYDNGHRISTGLAGYLREKGAEDLYFCGLAGDICVYFTLRDAIDEGFNVKLLLEGTRPLDEKHFSNQLKKLKELGLKVVEDI